LKNETALITGGGTGLGLGMARAFVEAGAKVVLVGRRESELRSAVDRLDLPLPMLFTILPGSMKLPIS